MGSSNTVRYGNQQIPVLEEFRVGGRVYRLLKKTGRAGRKRYWAHDPRARDFRQLLLLSREQTSRQHLAVLRRLSNGNPNLPTILDYHPRGDEFVVVTNWVHGENVKSRLDAARRNEREWPGPLEVMKLYRGLAHGLSQMHRHRRIMHGDIKPENLIIAREPNRLVMIDFGNAWMMERTIRREPGEGKSRFYPAPEQLQGEASIDARADRFSATVVAYEMLTGVRPYGDRGGEAGLTENRSTYEPLYKPPSRVSPMRDKLPPRIWRLIDEVISMGLKLDADDRFPSREVWLDALEDLHCEIRRKGRLGRVESTMLRMIGWFGDRIHRVRKP